MKSILVPRVWPCGDAGALVPSRLWKRGNNQDGPGLLFQLGNILSAGGKYSDLVLPNCEVEMSVLSFITVTLYVLDEFLCQLWVEPKKYEEK